MPAYTKEQLLDYAVAYGRIYAVHAFSTEGRKRHSTHRVIQDPWGHFYFLDHDMCSLDTMLTHVRLQNRTEEVDFQDACGLFALYIVGKQPPGDFAPSRRSKNKFTKQQLVWFDKASLDLFESLRQLRTQRDRNRADTAGRVGRALPLHYNVHTRCKAIIASQTELLQAKLSRVLMRAASPTE